MASSSSSEDDLSSESSESSLSSESSPSSPSSPSSQSSPSSASSASSPSSPSSPSSSSGDIAVEIEINKTSQTNDDLVRLKSTVPAHRFKTACRIKCKHSDYPDGLDVTLSNPDGRVRFPTAATLDIHLPADGEWKEFEISGENKSDALNDAVIIAKHSRAPNKEIGRATVTVYYFEPADITVAQGHQYVLDANGSGYYAPADANSAVNFAASARIKPDNVNCDAPQLKNIYIGIAQNSTYVKIVEQFSGPEPLWNPGVAAGTTVHVPAKVERVFLLDEVLNDSSNVAHPIYKSDAISRPVGCGGENIRDSDTPNDVFVAPKWPMISAGVEVGDAHYQVVDLVTIEERFTIWVVTLEKTEGGLIKEDEIWPLRQSEWSVNVDSTSSSPQVATTPTADHAVETEPNLDDKYTSDELNALSKAPQRKGDENVTFTKDG